MNSYLFSNKKNEASDLQKQNEILCMLLQYRKLAY